MLDQGRVRGVIVKHGNRRVEEKGQQSCELLRVRLGCELECEVGERSYPERAFGTIEEHNDVAVVGCQALAQVSCFQRR